MCIQLRILLQRIIDNMKTILAFLALATLASAQPSMRQACPPEKPQDCGPDRKYPLIWAQFFAIFVRKSYRVYQVFNALFLLQMFFQFLKYQESVVLMMLIANCFYF